MPLTELEQLIADIQWYLRQGTPEQERIRTTVDFLTYSEGYFMNVAFRLARKLLDTEI